MRRPTGLVDVNGTALTSVVPPPPTPPTPKQIHDRFVARVFTAILTDLPDFDSQVTALEALMAGVMRMGAPDPDSARAFLSIWSDRVVERMKIMAQTAEASAALDAQNLTLYAVGVANEQPGSYGMKFGPTTNKDDCIGEMTDGDYLFEFKNGQDSIINTMVDGRLIPYD